MTAKDHTPQPHRKSSRWVAILSVASTIISVLFFVYASIKNTEAEVQRELAYKLQRELQEVKELAERAQEEAKIHQMIAIDARHESEQRKSDEQKEDPSGKSNQIIEQLKKELEAQRKIAEQNLAIARMNEEQAIQIQRLASQQELAAKKALEDCQNKKQ